MFWYILVLEFCFVSFNFLVFVFEILKNTCCSLHWFKKQIFIYPSSIYFSHLYRIMFSPLDVCCCFLVLLKNIYLFVVSCTCCNNLLLLTEKNLFCFPDFTHAVCLRSLWVGNHQNHQHHGVVLMEMEGNLKRWR